MSSSWPLVFLLGGNLLGLSVAASWARVVTIRDVIGVAAYSVALIAVSVTAKAAIRRLGGQ